MNYWKFSLTCICWNNVQCVYYTLYSWNFSPKCIIDIISSYEVSTFTNRIHTQIQSQISLFLDSALKFNYFKYRLLQYHQSTNSDSNFTFILYQLSAITIPWESKSGFLLTFVGSFLGMCGVKILDNDAQIASETLWPIYSCFIFLNPAEDCASRPLPQFTRWRFVPPRSRSMPLHFRLHFCSCIFRVHYMVGMFCHRGLLFYMGNGDITI